ncbi:MULTISPECIES: hypothetical protein [Vibrio]|uniref:Lipoprotein n=3 Tax=Vibrio cyclitrophicus TaxID=47951 RepID=A0A7Z1S4I7_9VIBR|nr:MULTISPECIES: hypothetical protein [Vibrio]KNH13198.1 hypothetical protein ACS79_08905 [Vibrio lentus]MBY7662339.1 hypothetical protein [Vibrio atlanticus]ERM57857.1 hypothetical protein M565_ctg5P0828 [Vibrio cyclitrophicus FF75]KAA8597283.1 hypothetical protein F0Z19_4233 [Vibrio cyclitrophicus]MBE8557805.1 hypothetical protein [Vibrio sp. OPT24]|tara:strand:- start:2168 stop:2719 length:552 start_codon:yes stop_codon:yes gene_type:complete
MKRFLIAALAIGITGCKTLPNTATDTLSEPQGNGALAIATIISKHDSTYPCETFVFDLKEKIDGNLVGSEPQTLRMFVYEDAKYALFDGIKPGNYILTQFRCNMRRGLAVNGGKSFLSVDLGIEHTIKENAVTVSPLFVYATQQKDRFFNVQVDLWEQKDVEPFQELLTNEVSNKWEVSDFEG